MQQQQGNLTNERDRDDEISRLTEVPPNQIPTSQQLLSDNHTPSIVSEIKQGFPRMDIFEILENESRGVSCLHENRALESERGFGKFKVNIKWLRVPGTDETGNEINPEDIPPDYANALQVNIVKGGLLSKTKSEGDETEETSKEVTSNIENLTLNLRLNRQIEIPKVMISEIEYDRPPWAPGRENLLYFLLPDDFGSRVYKLTFAHKGMTNATWVALANTRGSHSIITDSTTTSYTYTTTSTHSGAVTQQRTQELTSGGEQNLHLQLENSALVRDWRHRCTIIAEKPDLASAIADRSKVYLNNLAITAVKNFIYRYQQYVIAHGTLPMSYFILQNAHVAEELRSSTLSAAMIEHLGLTEEKDLKDLNNNQIVDLLVYHTNALSPTAFTDAFSAIIKTINNVKNKSASVKLHAMFTVLIEVAALARIHIPATDATAEAKLELKRTFKDIYAKAWFKLMEKEFDKALHTTSLLGMTQILRSVIKEQSNLLPLEIRNSENYDTQTLCKAMLEFSHNLYKGNILPLTAYAKDYSYRSTQSTYSKGNVYKSRNSKHDYNSYKSRNRDTFTHATDDETQHTDCSNDSNEEDSAYHSFETYHTHDGDDAVSDFSEDNIQNETQSHHTQQSSSQEHDLQADEEHSQGKQSRHSSQHPRHHQTRHHCKSKKQYHHDKTHHSTNWEKMNKEQYKQLIKDQHTQHKPRSKSHRGDSAQTV